MSMVPVLPLGPGGVPDVPECHGHPGQGATLEACPQCDGGHAHIWVVVRIVIPTRSRHDAAVRCRECGGRGCAAVTDLLDGLGCRERRHHTAPHAYPDGTFAPVGVGSARGPGRPHPRPRPRPRFDGGP